MVATLLVMLAGLAIPPFEGCGPPLVCPGKEVTAPVTPSPEATDFFDNFDSYATGSMIGGQGGWTTWDNGLGTNAPVSSAQSASAPNSLNLVPGTPDGSDIVHEFGHTSGQWVLSCDTYVPSGQASAGYVIVMNQYMPPGTLHWSVVVKLDPSAGIVSDDVSLGTPVTPLLTDQWVEVRVEIDLDTDELRQFYNGVAIGMHPDSYSGNWVAGGLKQIAALDLYSNGINMFVDNVSLKSAACYADCEKDGDLDIFDFLCFQGEYANQSAYADCESDGDWDIFDFLCFQGLFANGCN